MLWTMRNTDAGSTMRARGGLVARLTLLLGALVWGAGLAGPALAQDGAGTLLEDLSISTLPGERVRLTFKFSAPPPQPLSFTIDDPARIALDFPGVRNGLSPRSRQIGIGLARSVSTAEAGNRTRAVVNLSQLTPYETVVRDNEIIVTLSGPGDTTAAAAGPSPFSTEAAESQARAAVGRRVNNVDFRRGREGEGRVVVTLSDPKTPINLTDESGRIVLDILDTKLPKNLQRRMDVTDFATPAQTIDTFARDGNVRMVIETTGKYDQIAYQSDNLFTVEIKPLVEEAVAERKKEEFTGERLSLNFQDIEVRSVLQLIADFTGLNVVVSDSVTGSLTLRLKNVPWDQALDIILKTKGLAMRQTGNVLLIAPSEEIAAREKLELEAQKQVQELAPLRSEFIQVNYARAADIAALLKAKENSLLSERGSVTIDPRTNTLLVQETDAKLVEIRNLVQRLDIPVDQVLIESRIVIAGDTFSKDLGVRFGGEYRGLGQDPNVFGAGTIDGTQTIWDSLAQGDDPPLAASLDDRLLSNLGVANPMGSIALTLLSDNYILDLELSAAQAENTAEVISSPRVITSNQTKARIEQGVEIPYQEASSSGATSVSFKKAVLSLDVTPNITPDDRVFLDLAVNKDSVGEIYSGVPSIDTRQVQTQVLVDNGQTVVLGGIYERAKNNTVERVPFFGDLPVVGRLFRREAKSDDKSELLIFVTPKIVEQGMFAGSAQ